MRTAYELAAAFLPGFRSKFSQHDFTLAQLFACLVVREQLKLSYRRTEALLRDSGWCQRLGMSRAPDHSTLCRAFRHLVTRQHIDRALDLLAQAMARADAIDKTLAIDSTCYDTHHFTRHYERRRRQHAHGDETSVNKGHPAPYA